MTCTWPNGTCACYAEQAVKEDYAGRVWMHCDEGLSLSKASMTRFVMHCLTNNMEVGVIHPMTPHYKNSQVSASVRLRPDQFEEFERVTKGKLQKPPLVSFNSSSPENLSTTRRGPGW